MISPRNRLLWLAGLLGLPLALLAVTGNANSATLFLLGGLAAVAAIDAVASRKRLRSLAVSLHAPGQESPFARMTKDAPFDMVLRVDHAAGGALDLRLAMELPSPIVGNQPGVTISLAADSPNALLRWPCRSAQRGKFRATRCHVETPSLLGLWNVRRIVPVQIEIRVYPNLLADQKFLSGLFLNRGGIGSHVVRQMGQGREFEKLREYVSGDSYETIHWKTTAKRGRPVTKVFQVERTQEVYVVVDSARLSGRQVQAPGGRTTSILERYVNAALLMAMVAQRQGDLFGLISHSDQVNAFLRSGSRHGHFRACRDRLYALQPSPVTPNFGEIVSFLRTRLRRRALVMFLTNLDDPEVAEDFSRHIGLLNRNHLVLAGMILPPNVRPLFSSPAADVDEIYEHLGGHLLHGSLQQLQKNLRRGGVNLSFLNSEHLCLQVVQQYISVKQRQLL